MFNKYYNINSRITLLFTVIIVGMTTLSLKAQTITDCYVLATAPTTTQNYVTTTVPRLPGYSPTGSGYTTCDLMQTIQYFDGLGRPLQTVQVKASPAGYDVVQPMAYDQFGREATKYLPYAATTSDGSYKSDALTTGAGQAYFYSVPPTGVAVIANAHADASFEPSPLNRVVEQGAPGSPWQLSTSGVTGAGHTVKMAYGNNNSIAYTTDSLNSMEVARYDVTLNSNQSYTLTANGYYNPGQLSVTITRDENWVTGTRAGTVEEYKDKDGHVILKRVYDSHTAATPVLSTYYVYDNFGNLAYVLPPAAGADGATTISQATLNNYCYQYRYDYRNRLGQKKIPGKGWDFIVYNVLDKPVATQDSLQRVANQWIFTKYDVMGRAVVTGIWNTAVSYASLHATLTGITTNLWETPVNTGNGYTNIAWPTTAVTTTLTTDYYDTYANIPGLPATYVVSSGVSQMTKSLSTVKKTAVLNTPANMLWDVMYYDDLGRNAKTYAQHYLGGVLNTANYDLVTSTYDFTNAPTTTTRQHWNVVNTTVPAVTIANQYLYDHMGRKLKTWEQITNGSNTPTTRTLISQLIYNEIGQIMNKKLHSTDSASFLQYIAYKYNERGWLLKSSAPLFEMQLQYNTNIISGIKPTAQYNGNIASQSWGTIASPNTSSFTYNYDKLNRLVIGKSADNNYIERGITYDQLGNINTLSRVYNGTLIDSLAYTYNNTNQVQSINDKSPDVGTIGYKTGNWTYAYDGNGNMVTDNSKGITGATGISYNLLNLPQSIAAMNTTYTYDAGGNKLRRVIGTSATDYINGIEYDGGTIAFIQTDEGRVLPNGTNAYNYEYYLTDNLGNTRLTFDSATGAARTVQQDNYLPFGMDISVGIISNPQNLYLYNKKELQLNLQLYDYGARFYDPVIARWTTPDPLAEISRRWSTYNYGEDNPIKNVDPDGMEVLLGQGEYGGDLYTGADAQNLFRGLQQQQTQDGGKDKKKKPAPKPKAKEKDDPVSHKVSRWTNYIAAGTIVVGLGPEDPAADAVAGGEEVIGQGVAGLIWLGESAIDLYTFLQMSKSGEGGDLSKNISDSQRKLIRGWFTQKPNPGDPDPEKPEGVTKETLETYKQIAEKAIKEGIDKSGEQARRLKLIENALKK